MIKSISRIAIVLCIGLSMSISANAQASPEVTQTGAIGKATVTITYSQPSVKGRTIWGGLVPYNAVWRTGANKATRFETSADISIEGEVLKAGTYGVWSIPGETEFTWIFSKTYDTWGTNYDSSADVLKVTSDLEKAENAEKLMITVGDGKISLHWADKMTTLKAN